MDERDVLTFRPECPDCNTEMRLNVEFYDASYYGSNVKAVRWECPNCGWIEHTKEAL